MRVLEQRMTDYKAPDGTQLGHINLRVSDIERSIAFYRDLLGFHLMGQYPGQAAFLSSSGYYHHFALSQAEPGATLVKGLGLDHIAINYPTRRDLAAVTQRLIEAGWPIKGTVDYLTHDCVYTSDPDGIGLELAWDRDRADWPWSDGVIAWGSRPLPLDELLAELDPAPATT